MGTHLLTFITSLSLGECSGLGKRRTCSGHAHGVHNTTQRNATQHNTSGVMSMHNKPTLQTHTLPQMNFPPIPAVLRLSCPICCPRTPHTCFWSRCRPASFCSRRRAARSHCWARCRILFFMKLRDSLPVPMSSSRRARSLRKAA